MEEKSQKAQISTKKALRGKKRIMFDALLDQLGVVTAAAKQTGIHRRTHYRWIIEDDNYKEWVEEVPEICLDFAENALFKQIKEGGVPSTIFYLKTKGKLRGYIEKQEIEHVGDIPVVFNLIEKSVEEIKNEKLNRDKSNDKSKAS